jgi:exonuclease VII large subunit
VAAGRVDAGAGRLEGAGRRGLRAAEAGLDGAVERLARRPTASLAGAERALVLHRARLGVLDPARALARGWTITRTAGGALVGDPGALADGALLVTTTAAGDLRSTVTRKVPTDARA